MLRKRKLIFMVTSLVGTVLALALTVGVASAHERRTIGASKYDVVVGFDKEPPYVNQQNAASIRVYRAGTQEPVVGVEQTLKVQIAFGGNEPKEFSLRAVFGQPGYYVADYIPTKVGRYLWAFVGDIEGTRIDEHFESGPGRFDDVQSVEPLQLPVSVPDQLAIANQAEAAQSDAASARVFGMAGVVFGIVGLVAGGTALAIARRR